MSQQRHSYRELRETVALVQKYGSVAAAADAIGVPRTTMSSRYHRALSEGVTEKGDLLDQVEELKAALKVARENSLTDEYVKRKIIGLKEAADEASIPSWVVRPVRGSSLPGVPSVLWSDWHWGEVVDPAQIGGVNEFNLAIARERARALVERTVYLLRKHVVNPSFPGIVVNLGGDMLSGDIHEELSETNEAPMMPALLDLYGVLLWALRSLADEFGAVFVPCVTGNHGRNTKKPRAKGRNFTNFDWLLYRLLQKALENDDRVSFLIPDGPDALYRIYGTRYLLTHGDQFRGGDGQIGPIGPITRGNKRKLARNSAIDLDYDTMLLGHWHQYMPLHRQIVNGCFPSGSLVVTDSGVAPIESVSVGDRVMSRDGSWQTVTHRFEKSSERGLVHLKVRGIHAPLSVTPNHLIWAIKSESKRCHSIGSKWDALRGGGDKPQWIPADFISPGDFVHIPRHIGTAEPIDEETAWAYGLYLAEGSTLLDGGATGAHNRICLTMHEREIGTLERWASWFGRTFGVAPRVYVRRQRSTSELVVSPGRDVCAAFRKMFGHRAEGKHVPDGALDWAPRLCAALIRGWVDGDGHTSKNGTTSATTVSGALAHQLFRMALSAGMRPSMSTLAPGGRRKHRSYTIHFNNGQESIEIDGELFYRVHARYRDSQVVPVYDLEVSGEHTYVVNHVGVHNSLKGYDEWANLNNFEYEPPTQAMWLTHPEHGITIQMPVYLGPHAKLDRVSEWVSWKTV